MVGGSDAGEHEELGRVDCSAADQHLAIGAYRLDPAICEISHAGSPAFFNDDPRDLSTHTHGQIAPAHGGLEIGIGCAPARAVLLRGLEDARALLGCAVEVLVCRHARFYAGFDKSLRKRIDITHVGYVERTAYAVVFVGPALLVLSLLEIGQDIGVSPARVAGVTPGIVVEAMPANIDHGVDRTGTAQNLAARPVHLAIGHSRLFFSVIFPIVWCPEKPGERGGNMDFRLVIRASG